MGPGAGGRVIRGPPGADSVGRGPRHEERDVAGAGGFAQPASPRSFL